MHDDTPIDPRTIRAVRRWLQETADELPDDPILLASIRRSVPDRRPSPWTRILQPGSRRPLIAGAIGTLAIILVGLALTSPLRDQRSVVGGPEPTTTPLPLPRGTMAPGAYVIDTPLVARGPLAPDDDQEVIVDVGEGWRSQQGGWILEKPAGYPPDGATFEWWDIGRVYVDPCHMSDGWVDLPSGSPLESLATILSTWGATDADRPATAPVVTDPEFGTFDGRPGFELTVTPPEGLTIGSSCETDRYVLWRDPVDGERWIQGADQAMRIRVIEVDTDLLFLVAGSFTETPAEVRAEQQAMLDSVRIRPRPATPSPSASSGS